MVEDQEKKRGIPLNSSQIYLLCIDLDQGTTRQFNFFFIVYCLSLL